MGKLFKNDKSNCSAQSLLNEPIAKISEDNRNYSLKMIVAVFFALISFILTVMNVAKAWWFMAGTTTFLVIGFSIAAYVIGKRQDDFTFSCVLALLVALVFSIYAVTGENEGFAILWIVLVPLISMNLLVMKVGVVLSAYYFVFLIVLFYTPLRGLTAEHYTATFMARFPILYATSFGGCYILAYQKNRYLMQVRQQAYCDGLTGLYNRLFYTKLLDSLGAKKDTEELTICIFDLNRLKFFNDTYGHAEGDIALLETARAIQTVWGKDSVACRIGGDEFAVVSSLSSEDFQKKLKEFDSFLLTSRRIHGNCIQVAYGYASQSELPALSVEELAKEADRRMYDNKSLQKAGH